MCCLFSISWAEFSKIIEQILYECERLRHTVRWRYGIEEICWTNHIAWDQNQPIRMPGHGTITITVTAQYVRTVHFSQSYEICSMYVPSLNTSGSKWKQTSSLSLSSFVELISFTFLFYLIIFFILSDNVLHIRKLLHNSLN
jgi:hypothetical protein